jgi:dipeptidyl-peptidase 4
MRVLLLVAAACGASPPPETEEPERTASGTISELPRFGPPGPPPRAFPRRVDEAADQEFLRDVTETKYFRLGDPSRPQLLPDGSQVLFLRAQPRQNQLRLFALDVASGQTRELVTPEQVLSGAAEKLSPEEKARRERQRIGSESGFTRYELSPDGKLVLAGLAGRAYVIGLPKGDVREVASSSFDEKLSPDGRWVSFVRDGELWIAPVATGKAKRLTSGATASVVHAQAEFVAQEEMGRYTGYWWAPDSKSLVYESYDTTGVERIRFGDPASPADAAEPAPYPRPGKANVKVSLGVISIAGGKTTWLKWDAEKLPYLADVRWQRNAPLTLIVQSRDQKDVVLLAAEPKTGATRELLREHDDAWVNLDSAFFEPDRQTMPAEEDNEYVWLPDGSGFLWMTERGGAWQLELHDKTGKLVRVLTPPEMGARGIRHVDAKDVIVVYGASPFEQHLSRVPLAGGPFVALETNPAFNDARFAAASGTYVLASWGVSSPFRLEVRGADGKRLHALPSIAEKPPFWPEIEVVKVGPDPGLWASIVRPRSFVAGRRYPVIVEVYGGPGHLHVSQAAWRYLIPQWIADHGFFVVRIDGRGTPMRGRAFERAIAGKLADVPLADQVTALQALGQREPAMDLRRVGIFGHSFGGYVAALAVLRRSDVFRAAVAAAPVADWLDYDTHYTERYLGVPGDYEVYAENGLIRWAAGLGGALLIIHGTGDDNVHFSHSLELADSLFRAGKRFEMVPMAGETHGFYDPRLLMRYYQRVFSFFREHL